MRVGVARVLADSSDFGLLAEQVPQNGRFIVLTPMNRRAKYDAVSFILGGEIRNRTNKQTHKNRQIVIDTSTPCLSACVDKK